MQPQPAFDALHQDALNELFNVGIGRAASSLAALVRHEVTLSIPEVRLLPLTRFASALGVDSAEPVIWVEQPHHGVVAGTAYLLFPADSTLSLVEAILGSSVPLDDLSELEQETVMELGNIMLNACAGSVANMLGESIRVELPSFHEGDIATLVEDLVHDNGRQFHALVLNVHFSVADLRLSGNVLYVMDSTAVDVLLGTIDRTILAPLRSR